ncbi:hypothetical protein SARC_06422 [Sphaeroforma arctica JP610]|uniref:Uncharacterized protein n=1 Tax=Sphaeroforma arctica JP610 TaxID=667725 RepID=A0A0L0FWP9_9EUKA|nr:hypothetical protein SARC_06422 [Sphaeroforma arctica JP610]KNC81247.1 hypothetical protein SARC_06422 [Sphaeroforma arctica JP610]|eukprot:XP_014155149.1 hypothetical protein SARC_06422 [Sphaeroforma arctica JP610]
MSPCLPTSNCPTVGDDCGNFIVIKSPVCPTACPTVCPTSPPVVNYYLVKSVCTTPPTPPPCPTAVPCSSSVTFLDMNGKQCNENGAQFLFVNNGVAAYSKQSSCYANNAGYKFLQYR